MLRITIELVPHGDESRKEVIGIGVIANDATGTDYNGNYKYHLSKWGKGTAMWKAGRIEDFARKVRGPWDLLYRVLSNAVGDRNT